MSGSCPSGREIAARSPSRAGRRTAKEVATRSSESIRGALPDKELIVIATGQYLGEGFDCPQLNALFLAFPLSFRGKLVQYTGRLLREYEGKTSVTV